MLSSSPNRIFYGKFCKDKCVFLWASYAYYIVPFHLKTETIPKICALIECLIFFKRIGDDCHPDFTGIDATPLFYNRQYLYCFVPKSLDYTRINIATVIYKIFPFIIDAE